MRRYEQPRLQNTQWPANDAVIANKEGCNGTAGSRQQAAEADTADMAPAPQPASFSAAYGTMFLISSAKIRRQSHTSQMVLLHVEIKCSRMPIMPRFTGVASNSRRRFHAQPRPPIRISFTIDLRHVLRRALPA